MSLNFVSREQPLDCNRKARNEHFINNGDVRDYNHLTLLEKSTRTISGIVSVKWLKKGVSSNFTLCNGLLITIHQLDMFL